MTATDSFGSCCKPLRDRKASEKKGPQQTSDFRPCFITLPSMSTVAPKYSELLIYNFSARK